MKTQQQTITYQAGTPIAEVERRFGLQRVIKLASNENPLGPSRRALEATAHALNSSHRYPEASSDQLKVTISTRLHIDPARVMISNGTTHLIDTIVQALCAPSDEILLFEQTFIYYRISAQNHNIPYTEVKRGKGFSYCIDNLIQKITPRTRLIFLAAPDNPTGVYISRAEVERLLAAMPERALLIFDEAYGEYVSPEHYFDPSELKSPKLLLLRTFSKVYGLAGFRCGYALGDAALIRSLSQVQAPFSVNALSQVAAEAALLDEEHLSHSKRVNAEERERLHRFFAQHQIPYVKSYGNFIMFNTAPILGDALYQRLLSQGIIIRPLDAYGLPSFVRVTLGLPEENQAFMQQLLRMYQS